MLFKRDKNNIDEDSDYSLDNKNDKNIDESNEDEDWSDNWFNIFVNILNKKLLFFDYKIIN